jgi:hypothetical protein
MLALSIVGMVLPPSFLCPLCLSCGVLMLADLVGCQPDTVQIDKQARSLSVSTYYARRLYCWSVLYGWSFLPSSCLCRLCPDCDAFLVAVVLYWSVLWMIPHCMH